MSNGSCMDYIVTRFPIRISLVSNTGFDTSVNGPRPKSTTRVFVTSLLVRLRQHVVIRISQVTVLITCWHCVIRLSYLQLLIFTCNGTVVSKFSVVARVLCPASIQGDDFGVWRCEKQSKPMPDLRLTSLICPVSIFDLCSGALSIKIL